MSIQQVLGRWPGLFRSLALLLCLGCPGVVLPEGAAEGQIDILSFESVEQERRYRALISEFRCPKCLNTNLAGSDAPIAKDLRLLVHRLLVEEGLADDEITAYLQARYGDFVLYRPPFSSQTWYIWLVPIGLGLIAVAVVMGLLKSARRSSTRLSPEDRARLDAMIRER